MIKKILIILFSLLFIFSCSQKIEQNLETKIVKNLVIVEKMGKIIKTGEEVFSENTNPENIISNGFFIKKDTILTTAHSVGNFEDIYKIYFKDGNFIEAKLLEKDEKKDIAKLKVLKKIKDFQKINTGKNIKIGDKVFTYFYNLETKKVEKKGGKIIKFSKTKIYTNIKLKKGDSGSPLFDKNQHIIGINTDFDFKNNLGISIKF